MSNFKVSESITNDEYWLNSSRSDEHLKSIEIQKLSMISGLCIFHDLTNISSGSRISQRLQRGAPTCYYCSQRSCAMLCFHRCLSFCSQGCVCGRHPPWQTPPTLGRHPPGQISPGQTPQMGRHPPAHCMLGYTHPLPTAPPPPAATAADGMHLNADGACP